MNKVVARCGFISESKCNTKQIKERRDKSLWEQGEELEQISHCELHTYKLKTFAT